MGHENNLSTTTDKFITREISKINLCFFQFFTNYATADLVSPEGLLLKFFAWFILLLLQNMNELRAGFSLDGYYKYDENRLGVFMKENSGHKYLIYNLELKLEVDDEKFEVTRISVKRAIEKLPHVRNVQRTTSNNMLL